ncbi:MAG: PDZ domain-containing protein [Bacteroidales bacterium]|nr:PDZ domain-containing protein [Bacteroidales bacterium]
MLLATATPAQEPIRFARTPDISPDGKTVAFSYLGDIWTVEAIGGVARPVTMHEAHDYFPCFSPDGRHIAFASNRHGQYDVFVVSAQGGRPTRLTFDSAHDIPTGWTPDGQSIVFSSSRANTFPSGQDCYLVPVTGGAVRKLPLFEAKEAYPSPTGSHVAFVRGPGTWYRKGYRGSSNDDIWIAGIDGSSPRPLTDFAGQDTSPMWAPDGKKVYYVSEKLSERGCANIVCQELTPGFADPAFKGSITEGDAQAITHHHEDAVRRARISANGDWIIYECGADVWIVGTKPGSTPRKLAVEVHADDKSNTEQTTIHTKGATEYALSPSEEHVVVVIHGELFLTTVKGSARTTRLTDHPAYDHSVSWSPDGKSLLFASDRNGVEDLYLLESDDPEQTELTQAHLFKVKPLTSTRDAESAATFSPKGDRIAFLRAGKLWLMQPDGTQATVLVDDQRVRDYDWSPDGKWIAFTRLDGSFASEVYVVPTDGSELPRNVSRYATYNGDVSWSQTNHRLAFVSKRRDTYAVHVLSLHKPTAPGVKASPEFDWEDVHLRVTRPTSMAAESAAISPDGNQVAFRSTTNGDDLWVAGVDGNSVGRVTTGKHAPKQIRWSRKSSGLIYFLNGSGEVRATRASYGSFTGSTGPVSEPLKVAFAAKLNIRQEEEFAEMFAQSWRALSDSFYDPAYHGTNWKAVRAKYQPLVAHVATKEDLYTLISLMLGELNASHLGISGTTRTPDEHTADLGLLFDDRYPGPGLKITEIINRGPADRRGLDLKPGDVVLAVDRTTLTPNENLSRLLNGKSGNTVRLDVTRDPANPQARRQVEILATSRTRMEKLMYERWVAHNAAEVARQSHGRVGYIHIPSMDDAGLETFMRSLYSDNFDKEAIVLDVRYNGGGHTHDQVLNYLTGKEHTLFRQRDGEEGLVMRNYDRKWTKPLAVLINNRSYSDAEIFPHAFRTLGLGKLVGQTTGGYVIGTGSVKLIDGSTFRVPRTGVFTVAGTNMEKSGVVPDVPVASTPEDWVKGVDPQLEAAVKTVQTDVAAWKRARGLIYPAPEPRPVTRTATDTTGTPLRTPTVATPAANAPTSGPAATPPPLPPPAPRSSPTGSSTGGN